MKLNFFFLFLFLFSIPLISAQLNVGEDNPLARGVNILPPEIFIVDTNATTACSGGEVLFGNGTCGTIAGSGGIGDFSFTDFQSSFNLNVSNGFVDYETTGTFKGLFNWIINLVDGSTSYLTFNSSTLSFNEDKLNGTISDIANTTTNINGSLWNETTGGIFYNGGNVGIGTFSPEELLHVSSSSSPRIMIQAENGDAAGLILNNSEGEKVPIPTLPPL